MASGFNYSGGQAGHIGLVPVLPMLPGTVARNLRMDGRRLDSEPEPDPDPGWRPPEPEIVRVFSAEPAPEGKEE